MPRSRLTFPIWEKVCAELPWAPAGSWQSYAIAALLVAAATAIRVVLSPWVTGVQFITYFPAVILATLLTGTRAGASAVVLSALSAWFLILRQESDVARYYAVTLFVLVAAADVAIIGALRMAVSRARALYANLRDSEMRFRTLLESAPDAVVVADRDGKVVLANVMTEKLFGYARGEMLGQRVELLIPERHREDHARHQARYHLAPQQRPMGTGLALFGRRKDGSEFPVEVSLSPVETSEGLLVFGAIRDITARKQHETELARASVRAEAATRAKSDFLSQMSHELRTPLNAVIGFAQILRLNRDKTLSNRQLAYCDDILRGGYDLLQLVNEILDLEQAESGKVKISPERIVVADALRRLRDTIEPLAAQAKVMLEVGSGREVPDIRADKLRLHQVLLNLVSNDIKYNKSGGSVIVSALRALPGKVRIVVADTGRGIPRDRQEELFKPFSRLGAELTNIQGTGIGLAYSRKVTEAMGGSIGFSSNAEGSTFWVDLPADFGAIAAAPAAGVAMPEEVPATGLHRLLYVEDNPANVRLMEHLIATRPDIVMLSAATPTLGLDLASGHHPDIIVLDMGMPEMSGLEMLAKLRELPAMGRTPIIALSAAAMPIEIEQGLAAGFFRYLTKPLDVNAFLAAVDEAIASLRRPQTWQARDIA